MRAVVTAVAFASFSLIAPSARTADIGMTVLTMLPRGELNENLDPAFGLGAQVLAPLGETPFLLGAEASWARYGEKRRRFFRDLDVVTSNEILAGHLVLRAQPSSGKVRPYIDALAGFKLFQTQSTLIDNCSCDDDVIDTVTELDDSAFSYGVGAGMQIQLDDDAEVFFEFKARYMRGDEATYLTRGSIDDSNLEDRLRESSTDAWSIHVGITFRL